MDNGMATKFNKYTNSLFYFSMYIYNTILQDKRYKFN